MKQLFYDTTKYLEIAETEQEISSKQFLLISAVLHSNMNVLAASLAILKILSRKSWFTFKRVPGDVKLNCLPHIDWLLKGWGPRHQLLPVYKKFYGPSDELDNVTLVEFYFCEKFYADFINAKDPDDREEALNYFVATLYRVAKPGYDINKNLDGDIRMAFNANAVKYYSVIIAAWPKHVKQAVLLYYDGCRKNLAHLYPEIFPKASPASQDNDNDMFGLIRGLAGGKYGDFEKTEALPLHTALRELQYLLAEEERIKAQTPAA